jgi:hypothetical protein
VGRGSCRDFQEVTPVGPASYGFAIVATDERFKSYKVPIDVNDISLIFLHGL